MRVRLQLSWFPGWVTEKAEECGLGITPPSPQTLHGSLPSPDLFPVKWPEPSRVVPGSMYSERHTKNKQLSIGWEKGAFILGEVEGGEGRKGSGAGGSSWHPSRQHISSQVERRGAKTPSFQPDKCMSFLHPLQSPTGPGVGRDRSEGPGRGRGWWWGVSWASTAQTGTDTPGEGQEVTEPGLRDTGGPLPGQFQSPLFASRTILALGAGYGRDPDSGTGHGRGRGLPEEGGQSHGPCSYLLALGWGSFSLRTLSPPLLPPQGPASIPVLFI